MRAKDVMAAPVVTVGPDTPIREVARLLVAKGISALPVVDAMQRLLGIVSEHDLLGLATDPSTRPRPDGTASQVMRQNVIVRFEETDISEIAQVMLQYGIKHIPIVSGDLLVGIVSRRDLVRTLVRTDPAIQAELQELLDEQESFLGHFVVTIEHGIVTLHGPKENDPRRVARLIARGVPGVIDVRFESDREQVAAG